MWHHSPFVENIKMNSVKYGHKFDEGENLVPAVITEPSIPLVFLFLVINLNVHNQESAYANRDKLLVIAIENVKVMQNAKTHGLKTIIKLTFSQESGPATSP